MPKKALETFGLLGYPLSHSVSPFIHGRLFAASGEPGEYVLAECAGLSPAVFSELKGFNVTIPHKQSIIPFLMEISEGAKAFGAVNTVSNRNGTLTGYNTDTYGLTKALSSAGMNLFGNVLILGAGGTGRMAAVTAVNAGCHVTVASRGGVAAAELAAEIGVASADLNGELPGRFDLMINCTPSGMYPAADELPVSGDIISRCGAVFDCVYNPLKTRLTKTAESLGIPSENGLSMLVFQAAAAHTIWYEAEFDAGVLKEIIDDTAEELRKIGTKRPNILLMGFMGSGKTTVGKKLSEKLDREFVDMDIYIETLENMTVSEIFKQKGEEYFRTLEHKCCMELSQKSGLVIAAGGGAMINPEHVRLFAPAKKIYLSVSPDTVLQRLKEDSTRPLLAAAAPEEKHEKISALLKERDSLYRRAADITIDGNGAAEELAAEIIALVK